jgi:hypothetical protein
MKNRLDPGLIGRARRVLLIGVPAVGLAVALVGVVPAQQAFAQDNSGGSISIGGDIAATVADAVSGIATDSDSGDIFADVLGGISTESNDLEFGEDEGTAVSDASGGDHNVSENSSRHDGDD